MSIVLQTSNLCQQRYECKYNKVFSWDTFILTTEVVSRLCPLCTVGISQSNFFPIISLLNVPIPVHTVLVVPNPFGIRGDSDFPRFPLRDEDLRCLPGRPSLESSRLSLILLLTPLIMGLTKM